MYHIFTLTVTSNIRSKILACPTWSIGPHCEVPVVAIIVVASIFGAVIIVGIVIRVVKWRRQKNLEKEQEHQRLLNNSTSGYVTLSHNVSTVFANQSPHHTSAKVKLLQNIVVESVLGEGYFGQVFKGKWADSDVALKHVKNPALREKFMQEVLILR